MGKHEIRKALREEILRRPCIVCGTPGVDPAHVWGVGAGGPDRFYNVVPMCREHHSEQHAKGWLAFTAKYPRAELALKVRGWKFDECVGKRRLWHPDQELDQVSLLPGL